MYSKVALAIAFSPRMEALIAEARRLIGIFQGELVLIHVGVKTPELESTLNEILKRHCSDLKRIKTIWKEGKPAKTILKTCEEEQVNLLVLGALKKEGLLTYYLGSIARKVIRKSPCSVLTLIDPKIETTRFSKVVINGTQLEVTPRVIEKGLKFCQVEGAGQIHILNEIKLYGLQMATAGEGSEDEVSTTRRKLVQEEIKYVQEILDGLDQTGLRINIKVTAGKWAVELVRYCESIEADLLIMGDENGYSFIDRIFPHDLEDILSELPCNLLIVK
ncbi:universal stress protein [Algoriphagus sp.]|uniref:universal stress protein n=1 Tax=Algoriphagus sp. TaxID=1872435 RepID=UPI00271BB3E7|nr:universal stress protein [Algoriphagus sp.]MDO8965548.1 universal stress protein [Algoriphagus sp.]MDP3201588.1 universal stress protein [Algoriphagus sp.]